MLQHCWLLSRGCRLQKVCSNSTQTFLTSGSHLLTKATHRWPLIWQSMRMNVRPKKII